MAATSQGILTRAQWFLLFFFYCNCLDNFIMIPEKYSYVQQELHQFLSVLLE